MQPAIIHHAFQPIFRSDSRVLILGTMPSPKSRENRFYYSHPQNRFWPLLADLFSAPCPHTPEEKTGFVLSRRIALWDVLASCEIAGASDASIRQPIPNDISGLLNQTQITTIFTTGKTATKLYEKLIQPNANLPASYLPSTSPANQAAFPYAKLKEAWKILLDALS